MIKKLLLALVAIVVLLVGGAFLLPSKVEVSREITIDAEPAEIFAVVNNLDRLNDWSPWAELDPDATYEIAGPEEGGVGQSLTWASESDEVGSGTQEIIESVENELVRTALDFGEMGGGTAAFQLEPQGDATKVIWWFETDMGNNPIGRYMGLMMDGWIGGDYEKGLINLKELIEGS